MLQDELRYRLPYAWAQASSVLMVRPGELFQYIWEKTAPDQAGQELSSIKLGIVRKEIDSGEPIALPHLGIDYVDGRWEISFIDGRHRFHELGRRGVAAIPVLVESNLTLAQLTSLEILSIPPEHIAKQFIEDNDNSLKLGNGFEEVKRKWALENEAALREWLKQKMPKAAADKCVKYYQQHGRMPPEKQLNQWIEEAKVEAREQAFEELRMAREERWAIRGRSGGGMSR